jgi:hypothetical protein
MLKDYWGEIPDTPEAREWVRQIMDRTIWTVKEVQSLYGLSQSTVSRLYTKHDWTFAFKKGSQILFLADYAKPWFDRYNAEQNINRSAEQLDPETGKRRPGRPKKVKGEYTYTLWGQEYTDTRPPAEVEREWKVKVASYYPHVMQDVENHKPLHEAMTYPDQYPDYRDHVRPLFAEIGKLFRKLATGQE